MLFWGFQWHPDVVFAFLFTYNMLFWGFQWHPDVVFAFLFTLPMSFINFMQYHVRVQGVPEAKSTKLS